MTLNEAVKILKLHNQWRRNIDDDVVIEMQNPTDIGMAIDIVVNAIDDLSKTFI